MCWCFNQSSPKRQPYGEDFHSAKQRLNPGNNSLREIPLKGTVAPPSEQFYLTTELSNVVGISFIFVTSFGRYPCRRWKQIFVSNFSVHRFRSSFPLYQNSFLVQKFLQPSSIGCQLTVRPSSDLSQLCLPPLFRIQPSGARLSLVWFPAHFASHTNRACEPNSFGSHCFCFDCWQPYLGQNTG